MFLQFVGIGKGVVSKVHVALEGESELAVHEQPRGNWFVVEPMEYGLERVETIIESQHGFGRETVVVYRHPRPVVEGRWVRVVKLHTPVIGQIGEERLELLATAGDSAKGYTIEFSDIRNSPRISILDQRNKGRNYNEVQESRQNRDECNESGNRRSCLTAVVALSG